MESICDRSNPIDDDQVDRYSIVCRVCIIGMKLSKAWTTFETNVRSDVERQDRYVCRRSNVGNWGAD